MLRRLLTLSIFAVLFVGFAFAGIPKDKAVYVGGTTSALKAGTESTLDVSGETGLVFSDWRLQYAKVTALSYGQHAGRRVGAAILVAWPLLFSKKRRHYLTIEYTDDQGKQQAAIFEVGKDAIRTDLKTLEVRTGKKVEYEDEEAKKSGNK